jgi:hypothetical protein
LYDSLPPQDVSVVERDLSLLLHGRDLVEAGLPASQAICLAERGLKTRVITKAPAGLHFLGHVVRKRLLAGLRRDPSSSSPLLGVDDGELIKHYVGAAADVCLSTDLTRASDLLPLDLVSAIVEGLGDSGRLPQVELAALRVLTGPQLVSYPTGEQITTSRGILMGLPTTWAILSLVHLWWFDESIARVASRRRLSASKARRLNRFMVCGDDALFVGMDEVAHEYNAVVGSSGGTPSAGKHFHVVGPRLRGVFLERLFEFEAGSEVTGGSRLGAIPLRGLVRPELPEVYRDTPRLAMSANLKMLFAVDAIWGSHPGGERALVSFLRSREDLYAFAVRLGLTNGLRLREGGSGLPVKGGPGRSARALRYRALSRTDGITVPSLLRGVIDSSWQLAGEMSSFDLAAFFADGTFVTRGPEEPAPPDVNQAAYVKVGTMADLVEQACVSMYADLAAQIPRSTRVASLSERGVLRAVRRWREGLPPLPADYAGAEPTPPVPDVVWVQRTRGPGGNLLYPRWVGETLASEARLRAKLVGEARFTRA